MTTIYTWTTIPTATSIQIKQEVQAKQKKKLMTKRIFKKIQAVFTENTTTCIETKESRQVQSVLNDVSNLTKYKIKYKVYYAFIFRNVHRHWNLKYNASEIVASKDKKKIPCESNKIYISLSCWSYKTQIESYFRDCPSLLSMAMIKKAQQKTP